jgi:hypothetical protein
MTKQSDPTAHTQKIKSEFQELADRLREDIKKIDDPKAQALFETSAEVLNGLTTAFSHYEEGEEIAWE